jgi:hypothetical protein
LRFEHGEQLYRQGFLKQAKEEFDGAIDLLLDLANVYPAEPRLQHEVSELVSRVHALELAALREGTALLEDEVAGTRGTVQKLVVRDSIVHSIDPTASPVVASNLAVKPDGSATPFAYTPCVRTYWPVSIVERAGMQTVFWLYARR